MAQRRCGYATTIRNCGRDQGTSFQSEMLYPSQFKDVLKRLLALYPDKMMYG